MGPAYRARRDELIGSLRGTVLEIGPGRGTNFHLLHPDVTWLGAEPSAASRRHLAKTAPVGSLILDCSAENLSLDDASVDAVLSTVVLCSVARADVALEEVRRALRPGGRFVFVEHVAHDRGTWQRRLQDAIAPAHRRWDNNCDPACETWTVLEQAGFADLSIEWFDLGWWRPFMGRRVVGCAVR